MAHGSGRGIAIHESFGTIVGQIAEVGVSRKGEVRVNGNPVNPTGYL